MSYANKYFFQKNEVAFFEFIKKNGIIVKKVNKSASYFVKEGKRKEKTKQRIIGKCPLNLYAKDYISHSHSPM
jgi:hypothetical protein